MEQDDISNKLGQITQWQTDHQHSDKSAFQSINMRLDLQDTNISMLPTKDEIGAIVRIEMINFFTTKGIMSKNILITVAIVIGSITVIAGGAKWLLGIIGFSYLSK